ncbi:Alpha/Beta hydrolase protein [Mycena alexandri]|uniref:Alpha/Beta hydrolase protein n=1 Tax=Mycena alexandri TaxID=1745969 RepID=A0AAD6SAV2_9AGAR|nr:Alpha/Beta hydrolase protein [Mycena alexandri]
MDAVAQMKETDIQTILFPTMSAFMPLLEPHREEIMQARKTFKYGATDRHQLDVYYPPQNGKKHPILVFVYGGGFVSGERTLPAPVDLGYGNLGLYFAKRGFVTIIPDYRLTPATTFPGPAEDIRDAISWAVAHSADLGPEADIESLFLLGHSAGGVHALTLLLEPSILKSSPNLRIKGAAVGSACLHLKPKGLEVDIREPANMYFGSPEAAKAHDPLGLFLAASPETIKALPALAVITSEHDPEWYKVVAADFEAALKEKSVPALQVLAEGHNHISFTWALGTGQGEKWAEAIVAWMESL